MDVAAKPWMCGKSREAFPEPLLISGYPRSNQSKPLGGVEYGNYNIIR